MNAPEVMMLRTKCSRCGSDDIRDMDEGIVCMNCGNVDAPDDYEEDAS
jgi:uncharacterized Zn finger protein (UPF0148 family)